MSLVNTALLPLRIARHIAGAVLDVVTPSPLPVGEPVVVGGMPEGVPPAATRSEPTLPAPAGWPFGEQFPRTCGTSRVAGGALFWTDFIYDDHGATGILVDVPTGGLAPPRGTYIYPPGPAARNGADIFRVGIGLTETDSWWRIDWNTLIDPSVPIGLFTFNTNSGRAGTDQWPAGARVRSADIDLALLISAAGASLIDPVSGTGTAVEHSVDTDSRSFLARVPRSLVEPTGTWTVRMGAGLANESGDGFADVHGGALPGQPRIYNVAFRTHAQETALLNLWSDAAQADALSHGDVSRFSVAVAWDRLAAGSATDEPVVTGSSIRWYVSSADLGQGVAATNILSTKPQFLGRVQPYSVCLPTTYEPGQKLPLTLLLHSLALGQNQFTVIDPRLLQEVCERRNSVVVTPLARGPSCWYFDEGELDVWEVWARVAEQLGADPTRTVVTGYSMGGYAAYKFGLSYPEVFGQAVVLAGPPACGVKLPPDIDIAANLDPASHCGAEGDTYKLLENARWLPFVIAHGMLDELVPYLGVVQQALGLDRLGYRYRFTSYLLEDHIVFAVQDRFEDPISHMSMGLRQPDPGHITFAWYPQLVRSELGIGPHRVWWLSDLKADAGVTARRGALAKVDARSHARPDPVRTVRRHGSFLPHLIPTPGVVVEQTWVGGSAAPPQPYLTLDLSGVGSLTLDVARAGLASLAVSTIAVSTDVVVTVTLAALPAGVEVSLDGNKSEATVVVEVGRHQIVLKRT
ncbi:MAG: peptidase [Mycobacteriaceae bacterium]|nr:peptidase [Mycobacteriaceae bacterium]